MKALSYPLILSSLSSLALLFVGVTPALPCDEDAVLATWVLPNPVLIPRGDGRLVAGIVACQSTSNEEAKIDFDLELVDLDGTIAETPTSADNEDDDFLGGKTIMGAASGAHQTTRVVSGAVYVLVCEAKSSSYGVEGSSDHTRPSFEGKTGDDNPTDLALRINNRERIFVTVPAGGPVPARCVGEESSFELVGALLTGVRPPETTLPKLPAHDG